AAVADQTLLELGRAHAHGGQEAPARIDDPFLTVEIERGIVAGQGQVGFLVGLDCAQVFPITVEKMSLNAVRLDASREKLLAQIRALGRAVEKLEKSLPVDEVNARAGQELPLAGMNPPAVQPIDGGAERPELFLQLRLLDKARDAPRLVELKD